jgi:hypothetical protein
MFEAANAREQSPGGALHCHNCQACCLCPSSSFPTSHLSKRDLFGDRSLPAAAAAFYPIAAIPIYEFTA